MEQQRIPFDYFSLKKPSIIFHSQIRAASNVMKKGHLVESGTRDELYDMKGTYREIFDASARSLNIEKLAKAIVDYGDDVPDTAS